MENNIARIRDEINRGSYPELAQILKANNTDLDALVAEESRQMVEIERRLIAGQIINPLPKLANLPWGFQCLEHESHRATWIANKGQFTGLYVIASIGLYDDRAWYHVSFSRSDRIPNYKDITIVKDCWVGKNRWAIQVHPELDKHVNIAQNCLHIWSALEDFYLPDFRVMGAI